MTDERHAGMFVGALLIICAMNVIDVATVIAVVILW